VLTARGPKHKGARRAPATPATDLATVNHALARAHTPVVNDAGELEAGVRATVERLAKQMERAHMTRFSIDLVEGTFDAEWAKRVHGRLKGGR
jgi:hypothetical protein